MQTAPSLSSPTSADQLVRREVLLGQLYEVEEVLEAARREVEQHQAACRAAESIHNVDPGQLKEATSASDGLEELTQRFKSMSDEIAGRSASVDEALQQMSEMLARLRGQMKLVVQRLKEIKGA